MTDWEKAKEKYLSSGATLKEIAEEFGLKYETLLRRAKREEWRAEREKENTGDRESRIERVTELLLCRLEKAIDRAEDMDSKEIKAMTGALKELRDMQREADDGQGGGKTVQVCFIGETEELSL